MLFSVMQTQNTFAWTDLLDNITYECNKKFNRSINRSPFNALFGHNGFNVKSNPLISERTPVFSELTPEEANEIDEFRYNYYLELSRITRRRIIRNGTSVSALNKSNLQENNEQNNDINN
jgi:hypothetical protein